MVNRTDQELLPLLLLPLDLPLLLFFNLVSLPYSTDYAFVFSLFAFVLAHSLTQPATFIKPTELL